LLKLSSFFLLLSGWSEIKYTLEIKNQGGNEVFQFSEILRSMPWSHLLTINIFFLVQEILQEIHNTAGGRQEDLSGQENQQEPDLLYTTLTSRDGSHKDNFGESLQIFVSSAEIQIWKSQR
jgi:hypothetical protein